MWSSFEKKRRRVARVALYSSLVIAGLVLGLGLALAPGSVVDPYSARWSAMDFASNPDVQLLQELIRIDTTKATGDQFRLASMLADRLERAGLEPHLERVGDNKAILWAEVIGVDPDPLVLLGHLDVEPIKHPEDWTHDPFAGEIEGPWIIGRGSYDMKSLLAAQVRAMEELARSERPPKRSVLFLALSDEESGSDLGAKLFIRRYPELWKRFWAILTEGGIVESRDEVGLKYWGIEVSQKRFGKLNICSPSRERLKEIRQSIRPNAFPTYRPHIRSSPSVVAFLEKYGPTRDAALLREHLKDPAGLIWEPKVFVRKMDPHHRRLPVNLQALFRDEIHHRKVREAQGGGYFLPLNLHLLPDSNFDDFLAERLPEFPDFGEGVSYRLRPPPPPSFSPLDHPVYQGLEASLAEEFSRSKIGPLVLWYQSTDAKFFRPLGIPTYGYSPFLIAVADTTSVGLTNERMILTGYLEGVERFVRVVRELVE